MPDETLARLTYTPATCSLAVVNLYLVPPDRAVL